MGLELVQECLTVTLDMMQTQSNLTRGRQREENISKISVHKEILLSRPTTSPPLFFDTKTVCSHIRDTHCFSIQTALL